MFIGIYADFPSIGFTRDGNKFRTLRREDAKLSPFTTFNSYPFMLHSHTLDN